MTVMPAECRSSLPQTATLSTFSDGSDRWPEDSSCWRCMVPMGLGGVDGRQKVLGREGAARTYHGRSSRVTLDLPLEAMCAVGTMRVVVGRCLV